jgi:putative addiction module killer protein
VKEVKDAKAKTIIVSNLERAAGGLFGGWKAIAVAGGLCEMRAHHAPGYRIYYSVIGQQIILLLAGSTKKSQGKAIAAATAYLADYSRRARA